LCRTYLAHHELESKFIIIIVIIIIIIIIITIIITIIIITIIIVITFIIIIKQAMAFRQNNTKKQCCAQRIGMYMLWHMISRSAALELALVVCCPSCVATKCSAQAAGHQW